MRLPPISCYTGFPPTQLTNNISTFSQKRACLFPYNINKNFFMRRSMELENMGMDNYVFACQ